MDSVRLCCVLKARMLLSQRYRRQQPSLVSAPDCISACCCPAAAEVYLGTYNSSAAPYSVSLSNMQITAGGQFGFGFGGLSEGVRGVISVQVLLACSHLGP